MVVGGRMEVPGDAGDELMEAKRAELERAMRAITERADNFWTTR